MFRPKSLKDIVGQKDVVERLDISTKAAIRNGEAHPHCLFYGPAGLGKSTFSLAVANEMATQCILLNGGNISKPKDILPKLLQMSQGDILFIDEIHQVPIKVCEWLYTAMEDFRVDLGGESSSMDLPKFCMIGATTEPGNIPRPMRDRFIYKFKLKPYSEEDLAKLITQASRLSCSVFLDNKGALEIARRARGVPRIALSYLKWLADVCSAQGLQTIDAGLVDRGMKMIGVEADGLNEDDRRYIKLLKDSDKPMGLSTLAASLDMDVSTITETIEPFLLQKNMIVRTSKGRKYNEV